MCRKPSVKRDSTCTAEPIYQPSWRSYIFYKSFSFCVTGTMVSIHQAVRRLTAKSRSREIWCDKDHIALLPRCLSNFRSIGKVSTRIWRLWDFTRSCGKTFVRLVNTGPRYDEATRQLCTMCKWHCPALAKISNRLSYWEMRVMVKRDFARLSSKRVSGWNSTL